MIMATWGFISFIVLSIGVLLSLAEFSCTEMDEVGGWGEVWGWGLFLWCFMCSFFHYIYSFSTRGGEFNPSTNQRYEKNTIDKIPLMSIHLKC